MLPFLFSKKYRSLNIPHILNSFTKPTILIYVGVQVICITK